MSRRRWEPSPVTVVLLTLAVALVGNLATNLIVVDRSWWRPAVFVTLGLLIAAVVVIEKLRHRAQEPPDPATNGTQVIRGAMLTGDGAAIHGPVLTGDNATVQFIPPPAPAMRAGVDVSKIATIDEDAAARLAEIGEVDEVTDCLAKMNPAGAAAVLNLVAPERLGRLLVAMNKRTAAEIVRQMDPRVVGSGLEAMQPAEAAQLLPRLLPDRQGLILKTLAPDAAAVILQQMDAWPAFLGQVSRLDSSDLVGILAAMPTGSIPAFVADPEIGSIRCARIVASVAAEQAALVVRSFPADQAARWLSHLTPAELVAAVNGLRDDEIVAILASLSPSTVTYEGRWSMAFVSEFGSERLVAYLTQLPAHLIAEWRRVLHHELTTPERNQLDEIMRKDSSGPEPLS